MPKFEALADYLREQIQSGRLKPGDRLPSTAQLKQLFNISYGTVRGAMLVLKAENLIQRRQGIGVFVADPTGKEPLSEDVLALHG